MAGRIGRFFTVTGLLLLLSAAWLWWLYIYWSADAIGCLYLPDGSCAPPSGAPYFFALPPYQPMVLWIGAAVALLGAILRFASRD